MPDSNESETSEAVLKPPPPSPFPNPVSATPFFTPIISSISPCHRSVFLNELPPNAPIGPIRRAYGFSSSEVTSWG
ncbi:hypothetical protein EON65_11535 [archaeon]|nr:MAG: hypothetical protein EON65_11535 [archaeon]